MRRQLNSPPTWPLFAWAACPLALVIVVLVVAAQDEDFYQGPGVTAAEILRGRGYIADEFQITTTAGYVLGITRGRNPLIPGGRLKTKKPILFVHGVLGAANNFLLNSFNVTPKDFTRLNISSMDLDELVERFKDEPSARSLPLLALDLGIEVWLLGNRGTLGSQQLVGDPNSVNAGASQPEAANTSDLVSNLLNDELSGQLRLSLDKRYWNFSLDDEAEIDFPQAVDFVLEQAPWTERISVVAHSAGGAQVLMGLSLFPEQLSAKISSCILWSPAYATSNANPYFNLYVPPIVAVIERIVAPVLIPPVLVEPLQTALTPLCAATEDVPVVNLCESLTDLVFGPSGRRQPISPQYLGGFFYSTSSHLLAQLGQTIRHPPNHTVRKFDFGPIGNMKRYDQPTPPAYDLSSLRNFTGLSFYAAATDLLVTPTDIQKTRQQLRGKFAPKSSLRGPRHDLSNSMLISHLIPVPVQTVPSRYHLINRLFNHVGFFFSPDAPRYAIIPSIWEIETMNR